MATLVRASVQRDCRRWLHSSRMVRTEEAGRSTPPPQHSPTPPPQHSPQQSAAPRGTGFMRDAWNSSLD
ncbi:hypothetical protein EON67_07350, partial [archaeon]